MRRFVLCLLVPLVGCKGLARQFLDPEVVVERMPPVNVKVITLAIDGDHFFTFNNQFRDAKMVHSMACDSTGVCLDLPFYDKQSGYTATVMHDRSFLHFYNLATVLPNCVTVRVEIVT